MPFKLGTWFLWCFSSGSTAIQARRIHQTECMLSPLPPMLWEAPRKGGRETVDLPRKGPKPSKANQKVNNTCAIPLLKKSHPSRNRSVYTLHLLKILTPHDNLPVSIPVHSRPWFGPLHFRATEIRLQAPDTRSCGRRLGVGLGGVTRFTRFEPVQG